ncbi:MAG: hypothetical protein HY548_01340 [Elusimicrobia bacterium]|nr:hypothetical protein [Elusimicrobiota bacterium]
MNRPGRAIAGLLIHILVIHSLRTSTDANSEKAGTAEGEQLLAVSPDGRCIGAFLRSLKEFAILQ